MRDGDGGRRVTCQHLEADAFVDVARIVADAGGNGRAVPTPEDDVVAFRASVKIRCADCHAEFGFRCATVGDLPDRPTISVDALELRVPLISPSELELLGPLAALRGDGLPGFQVRQR